MIRPLVFLALATIVQAAPQRVVSLGGDVTEIAFALGRGDEVIAVDITSTYPDAARNRAQVGYVRALSAEGILAQKPDLILASGDAGPPETLAQLKTAGIAVVALPKDHSLEGIRKKILVIAEALDAKPEGEKIAAAFEADRRAAEAAKAGEPIPAVYVMARSDGALIGAGVGTAADTMLAAAGLRNVMSDVKGYKPVSGEALVALAPAMIVTGERTIQASGGLEAFKQNPALRPTPAVKSGHVLVFDDMYLLGLGPRAARAARELALAAHE